MLEPRPWACAQRELRQETGHEAQRWTALGAFCLDPNLAQTQAQFVLARAWVRLAAPYIFGGRITRLTRHARLA